MHFLKKCVSAAISTGIILGSFSFGAVANLQISAATFEDINQSSMFVKQQSSDTCTLASNVMMLRRTAMLNGDSSWASITEAAVKPILWYEGKGMLLDYTYKGITVTCTRTASTKAEYIRTELINALREHPEGVVIYDYEIPHAVLLTDYTDGVFYCADPVRTVASGRMPISKSSVQVENIESYWYVVSPDVNFSSNDSERWQVTSTSGINLRKGAGTSYAVYTTIPYQTQITVTDKKTADGYTWGYTTYGGYSGWCVLDYAKLIDSDALTNNSSLSSTTITKGSSVTINGNAIGGTGSYKYIMLVRKKGENLWTTIRPSSTETSYTWTPSEIGTYNVWIKVTDANGNYDNKIINLTVRSTTPLKNNSTLSATTIIKGSSVTIKGSAIGGTSPYKYIMLVRKKGESLWTTIRPSSTEVSYTWTPSEIGTYNVWVKVTDADGTSENKIVNLNVISAVPLTNTSTFSATTISLGSSIKITGRATGGTGIYTYAMMSRYNGEGTWETIKEGNATASYTWTPKKAGKYNLWVKVTDSSGDYQNKIVSITVKD